METFFAILVLILIVGSALFYVIRAKKRGQKCIGCPNGCRVEPKSDTQPSGCSGCCSGCCGCKTKEEP